MGFMLRMSRAVCWFLFLTSWSLVSNNQLEAQSTSSLLTNEEAAAGDVDIEPPSTGPDLGVLAGRPTVRPTRTSTPPRIDGQLDDEVWKTAAKLTDFVQYQPIDGAPASEPTEIYIAYDSDHLYFGFYAHYSDPSIMRANRVDRDRASQDDLLTIYFDTFMDQQRSYDFDVNAYNVQGDGIINISGRRGRGSGIPFADRSWDTLFDSGAQIVEDGFTAEMAIPFKSLRYPQQPEGVPHRWGFQFVREIKELNREDIVWAPMSRDVSSFMAQMGVIEGMTNLSTSRNLEIMPTFTAIQFGSLQTNGQFPVDTVPEGGLNFKYGVTSNLVADATFNPDFSQIESDRPQIEVNRRFPLFFPELRPFFIEGNEIFDIQGPVTFVHTRTIVDPLFGAKLTGKTGKVAIGILAANDEGPGNVEDRNNPLYEKSAQTFIGRVKYDLYTESHIGAIVTSREFEDSHSTLGGVDASLRLSPNHTVGIVGVGTRHKDLQGVERDGHVFDLNLRQNGRHLDWSLSAYEISRDFDTEVGFVRRTDQRRTRGNISYRWFPQNWIIDWGPRFSYGRNWNFDGVLEDENAGMSMSFSLAKNLRANTSFDRDMERFGGINFLQNRYRVGGGMNNRSFSVNASFDTGDQIFFDWDNPYLGRETGSNVSVSVRPVSSLQSQISLNTSRFTDPTNGNAEIFDVQIIRAQTTYQISNPLLIRNITEYDTFDRQFDFNLLVTYRVNGGTVFYVGYDDHYRQEDQIDHLDEQFFMSNNFRRTNRAVFTKLQYLFRY